MNYRVTSYKFVSKISSRLQVTSYNSYKIQSYILFIIESSLNLFFDASMYQTRAIYDILLLRSCDVITSAEKKSITEVFCILLNIAAAELKNNGLHFCSSYKLHFEQVRMYIFFPAYNFTFLTSYRLHISTSELQVTVLL